MLENNFASFNPSVCISAKVRRLERATSAIFRKHLLPLDITESQLSILFVLAKTGGLTQKQLADFAMLEKSTINRNLARLHTKDFITRQYFPMIQLTYTGKEFVVSVIPAWENAMQEIKNMLTTNGEDALNLLLLKIKTN